MEIKHISPEKLVPFKNLKVGEFCYYRADRTHLYIKVPVTAHCTVICVDNRSEGIICDSDMVLPVEVTSITTVAPK